MSPGAASGDSMRSTRPVSRSNQYSLVSPFSMHLIPIAGRPTISVVPIVSASEHGGKVGGSLEHPEQIERAFGEFHPDGHRSLGRVESGEGLPVWGEDDDGVRLVRPDDRLHPERRQVHPQLIGHRRLSGRCSHDVCAVERGRRQVAMVVRLQDHVLGRSRVRRYRRCRRCRARACVRTARDRRPQRDVHASDAEHHRHEDEQGGGSTLPHEPTIDDAGAAFPATHLRVADPP